MMNLVETLDFYAMKHQSTDLFLMLQDYVIDERIDRDLLNRIIIKELGNATPFTNETTILKFAIEEFFGKYEDNIKRLIDTMYLEYNPIDTKNIKREVNESEQRESDADILNTDKYGTKKEDHAEQKVSAYDSNEYQPKEKNDVTDQTSHNGETTSDIHSEVGTEKGLVEKITGKDGDSSYQSLIKQERKLAEFNIFNWIIKLMRKELFLLVY